MHLQTAVISLACVNPQSFVLPFYADFLPDTVIFALQLHISLSSDYNDILQCTPCCKINIPGGIAESRPCALRLNNWQQAAFTPKGNPPVRDCLRIVSIDSTRGHLNEEKEQSLACFSWSRFLLLDKMTSACSLYK